LVQNIQKLDRAASVALGHSKEGAFALLVPHCGVLLALGPFCWGLAGTRLL
jgi:hypothetical protein